MTDTDELVRDGDDLHALMERAVTGLQPPDRPARRPRRRPAVAGCAAGVVSAPRP